MSDPGELMSQRLAGLRVFTGVSEAFAPLSDAIEIVGLESSSVHVSGWPGTVFTALQLIASAADNVDVLLRCEGVEFTYAQRKLMVKMRKAQKKHLKKIGKENLGHKGRLLAFGPDTKFPRIRAKTIDRLTEGVNILTSVVSPRLIDDVRTVPLSIQELAKEFEIDRTRVERDILGQYWHEAIGKRYRIRVADMPLRYHQRMGLKSN